MRYLFLFFSIIIILFESKRKKTYGMFDMFSAINYVFIIYYGLVPFGFLSINLSKFYENWALPSILRVFYYDSLNVYRAFVMIILAYVVTLISYYTHNRVYYTWNDRRNIKKHSKINYGLTRKVIINTGIVFAFLGTLGIVVFALSSGGFISAVIYAEYFRSGDVSQSGALLTIRILQPFIVSAFFIFDSVKSDTETKINSKREQYIIFLMWIFTFCMNIYYLLIQSSRAKIVSFIGILFLSRRKKINLKSLGAVAMLVVFFFAFGDSILAGNEIRMTLSKKMIVQLLVQTGFPFVNVCKTQDLMEVLNNYRFFSDSIYVWFINLIPTKLLSLLKLDKITNLYIINNKLMKASVNVPVDYVSFGYWQFGYVGIIINSFVAGWILRRLESALNAKNKIVYVMYLRVMFAILGALVNFEPENIIRTNMDIIVLVIIYLNNFKKAAERMPI